MNAAGIRMINPHDHPKRGGLAGTIWSNEAVNRPLRHGQGQIVNRNVFSERLRHVFDFNNVHMDGGLIVADKAAGRLQTEFDSYFSGSFAGNLQFSTVFEFEEKL